VLQYLILAVIFCEVLSLLADGEFDENVRLQDIFDESKKLAQPHARWMGDYRQHPWWIRPRSIRKKNKKVKSGLPKRMQQNGHRRRMQTSSKGFHLVDDSNFGQMDDFISNQRHRDEEKAVLDPQRIRIRIRLRQQGPVKRHAKQGKKRSKKISKKLAEKLATQEAMALVLKDFLRPNKNGLSSHKAVRKLAKGYRRVGKFALHRKGSRRMKVRAKKRKSRDLIS
jgi:hypothetical protein